MCLKTALPGKELYNQGLGLSLPGVILHYVCDFKSLCQSGLGHLNTLASEMALPLLGPERMTMAKVCFFSLSSHWKIPMMRL